MRQRLNGHEIYDGHPNMHLIILTYFGAKTKVLFEIVPLINIPLNLLKNSREP